MNDDNLFKIPEPGATIVPASDARTREFAAGQVGCGAGDGAAIASISLRAGIEFLRAAPAAAEVLEAAELRSWGELGRRLAMGDVETAISFFRRRSRRALQKSRERSSASLPTLLAADHALFADRDRDVSNRAGTRASDQRSEAAFASLLEVASEIARRSAKHSAEFLKARRRKWCTRLQTIQESEGH